MSEAEVKPFRPGNLVALRHGAYSPRRVEPLAQELVDVVLADPSTACLQAARWRPAVWAWARAGPAGLDDADQPAKTGAWRANRPGP